jgi:two-component system, sensor histidine kinase
MSELDLYLTAEEFAHLFPFHFAFGPELRIMRLGAALSRIYPQLQTGTALGEHFRIKRPHIAATFEEISQRQQQLFILQPLNEAPPLRGQMLLLSTQNVIVFLGAPWITSLQQLSKTALTLADFAIHDPVSDLLTLLQAQQTAIYETEQLAKKLASSRDKALTSSRLKSEFLATVSHEIRTPMNGVTGMTELLLETPLSDEQREFATSINDAAHALLTILNDILDYSKIEAGKLSLDIGPTSIIELVSGITSLLSPQASAKGLRLVTEIDPGIPPQIAADAGRLRQVLLNLIVNALKFTVEGGVTIRIELIASEHELVRLRVAVIDTGIGIAEEDQQCLFLPFSQADGSITRRYGGTGLGLAISKSLIELMGGEIGCISMPGRGSTFWIAASFKPIAQPEQLPTPASAISLDSPSNRVILIVEDTLINQKLALKQLDRLGYSADTANNGHEAVEMFSANPLRYSLVLMDCHMPGMDGYAATKEIRRIERGQGRHTPIIAVTASAMQENYEACINAGMDDVLTKPTSIASLRSILEHWMSTPQDEILDPAVLGDLLDLYKGDAASFAELISDFQEKAAAYIADMHEALACAQGRRIARAAHGLQQSSHAISGLALAQRSAEIAALARSEMLEPAAALIASIAQLLSQTTTALAVYSDRLDT